MKRDYFSRLSLWARWYLSKKEAAEVLEDYREIIDGRSEEELRRDIGRPKDAVCCLVQPAVYQRWLKVFAVLSAAVLIPAVSPFFHHRMFWWNIPYAVNQIPEAMLLAVWILSFLWFRQNGGRTAAFPKAVLLWMLVPAAGMVWAWYIASAALYQLTVLRDYLIQHPLLGQGIHLTLLWSGLAMGLVSLLGLIKARLGDRRWRALYVFGLTGTLLNLSVWAFLTSMNLDVHPGWQTPILIRCMSITVLGLAGTAVSLC